MSSHLRELLEQKTIEVFKSPKKLDWTNIMHGFKSAAEFAVCFELGEAADLVQFSPGKDDSYLRRLPYPVTCFEFSLGTSLYLVIAVEGASKEIIQLSIFLRRDKKWYYLARQAVTSDGVASDDDGLFFDHCGVWGVIVAGLCAMSCINVARIENVPSPKLQASRLKKGKKPLFSYWTLHLKDKVVGGRLLGGTKESPRLHLVRGHIHHWPRDPSRYWWVEAYARGNKSKGVIHKDYRLDR